MRSHLSTMANDIETEIARLQKLVALEEDIKKTKITKIRLWDTMGLLTEEQKEQKQVMENHYTSTIEHLEHKIKFWEQINKEAVEPHMIVKLNETMTTWLEASSAYFGKAYIKNAVEEAKCEYERFKKFSDAFLITKKKLAVAGRSTGSIINKQTH
mgnify:CR=1 FL=1